MLWLAILGVICAVIGAIIIFVSLKWMYFDEPVGEPLPVNDGRVLRVILSINVFALLALGILWNPIIDWCQKAFAHLA